MRDLRRQVDLIPSGAFWETILDTLVLVSRLLHQAPRGGGKSMRCMNPTSIASPRATPVSATSSVPKSALPRQSTRAKQTPKKSLTQIRNISCFSCVSQHDSIFNL